VVFGAKLRYRKLMKPPPLGSYLLAGFFALVMAASGEAAFILDYEWGKFFRERVAFAGFVENTTGLSIAAGDHKFSTSNRFIMSRLTFQPEFNIQFAKELRLFLSWRFVKEPRYSKEARDRRNNVPPLQPLDNTFYDEDSFKPWELVVDLNPNDQLNLRFGKQFISWGETDGLRLLDIINSQDGTFSPPAAANLFSLDETRIPAWGLRAIYKLFPASHTSVEFIAMPGFDERRKRVDESAPVAGRWAPHPETRMPLGRLFTDGLPGRPVIIPSISRILPDAGNNWRLGGRITHNIGKLNLGVGYLYLYNPQPADLVFKLQGVSPGPGPVTTVAQLKLLNDRTRVYAAHFNYPLEELKTALKGEIAFYPSKPYNISNFPGTAFRAGPDPRHPDGTVEKHTLRYSLGTDHSVFIPLLHPDDPWRDFRISFQLFQSIIFDHEDGIRAFSTAEKIKKVTTSLTLRLSTGYLGDTILPDVFVGYDPEGYWLANPALSYIPAWNEKIRLTLTAALYGGRNKFKSFGSFDEKDSVFLKMRYQF
jgi:hypothetical protein